MRITIISLVSALIVPVRCLSPPTADEAASYLEYSRILAAAANPVSMKIARRFDNFIKTVSKWAPTIAGAASGLAVGSIPLVGWIIGPYVGTTFGAAAGAAYTSIHSMVKGVTAKSDPSEEFHLAQSGFKNLSDALTAAKEDARLWSAVGRVDEYFSMANVSTQEYQNALKSVHVPASSNLRVFWETREKVLTVLAGGETMAESVQKMGDKIKLLPPGVIHTVMDMATSFTSTALSGITAAANLFNSERLKLQADLREARERIAKLNNLDERSGIVKGSLRSTIGSIARRGLKLMWR